jgi:hypothetical protein
MRFIFLIISFIITTISYSQAYNWIGTYTYVIKPTPNYIQGDESLTISKSKRFGYDFEWKIEAVGQQLYYIIKGYGINKGEYVDFYLEKVVDGAYYEEERVVKTKPLFKMQYNGKVLTRWLQPAAQKAFHPYFKPD